MLYIYKRGPGKCFTVYKTYQPESETPINKTGRFITMGNILQIKNTQPQPVTTNVHVTSEVKYQFKL